MIVEPSHLDFPFHVFSYKIPDNFDLSFSYHVVTHNESARGVCNDIPCNCCPFTCKDGIGRQEQLLAYAKKYFPEHQI